ncbi:hypothetical protein [Streptomyces sp. NBC_01237]|uniref:hypothetical protein n=1 Tax=Streptomyces sp. NBC_01237 TaxID=2903790 RepID=UPI002DD849E8|nr:hypothetical protein [Streptomyces sp. NBC_01237]WRZ76507.1 hypothetical protein OG251_35565 [Streptomyces sp. NBC_01237]
MSKKPAHDPTYGYDPETATVRVGQHDLARLLLMFRKLMREQLPGKWKHMDDYDLSFERLADAVDASSEVRHGKRWTGPDVRMRCTTTEAVYAWPEGAPYDGEASFTWAVPGYGSHATKDEGFRGVTHKALCGFSWTKGDRPRRVEDLPDCPECRREVQLGAERPRGRW